MNRLSDLILGVFCWIGFFLELKFTKITKKNLQRSRIAKDLIEKHLRKNKVWILSTKSKRIKLKNHSTVQRKEKKTFREEMLPPWKVSVSNKSSTCCLFCWAVKGIVPILIINDRLTRRRHVLLCFLLLWCQRNRRSKQTHWRVLDSSWISHSLSADDNDVSITQSITRMFSLINLLHFIRKAKRSGIVQIYELIIVNLITLWKHLYFLLALALWWCSFVEGVTFYRIAVFV